MNSIRTSSRTGSSSSIPPLSLRSLHRKPFRIPFTRIAREKFKREVVANIIALGALTQLTPIVSPKAMEAAVLARVPKGTEKLNRDALRAGIMAARRAKKEGLGAERPRRDSKRRPSGFLLDPS